MYTLISFIYNSYYNIDILYKPVTLQNRKSGHSICTLPGQNYHKMSLYISLIDRLRNQQEPIEIIVSTASPEAHHLFTIFKMGSPCGVGIAAFLKFYLSELNSLSGFA